MSTYTIFLIDLSSHWKVIFGLTSSWSFRGISNEVQNSRFAAVPLLAANSSFRKRQPVQLCFC